MRKDTRPSPRFSVLIATKSWAGPGNEASTRVYFLKGPYWGQAARQPTGERDMTELFIDLLWFAILSPCGNTAILQYDNCSMLAFSTTALDKANHLTAFFCMN